MKSMVMDDVGEGEVRCLVDVAKQFKHWQQSCVRGDRIHAALWGAAVQRCQEHTPQREAYVLRIALAGVMQRLRRAGLDTEFLEVNMSTSLVAMSAHAASRLDSVPTQEPQGGAVTPRHECMIELENVHRTKMRVQINGQGLASLGPLLSSFGSAT